MPWRAGGAGAVQPPHRRSQVKQRSRLARAVFQGRRNVGGLPGQGPPPPDVNQVEMEVTLRSAPEISVYLSLSLNLSAHSSLFSFRSFNWEGDGAGEGS